MKTSDLLDIAHQSLQDPVDEAGGLFPPSRYYAFFKRLATIQKPRAAVVLGVCGGGDCYHLAKGHPHTEVFGVDIERDHPDQIDFIEKNCPNFHFHKGDSVQSVQEIAKTGLAVDFLFIDTAHTPGSAMAEFLAWVPCLAPGAIVVFDDLAHADMNDVWDSLPEPKIRLDFLHEPIPPYGGGFGAIIMPIIAAQGYAEAVMATPYEIGN